MTGSRLERPLCAQEAGVQHPEEVEMKPRTLAQALSLVSLISLSAIGPTYNPPGGPDNLRASLNSPHAHGVILNKAIEILRNDGHVQMADYFQANKQELFDGLRRADKDGGDFTITTILKKIAEYIPSGSILDYLTDMMKWSQDVPANSMGHFYNPNNGLGLILFRDAGLFSTLKDLVSELSLLDWKFYTVFGPMPPATEVCEYYYARAVDEMRLGNSKMAMTYLGWAVHLVADLTVPQHATDKDGSYPGGKHMEYETECDKMIEQKGPNGEPYGAAWHAKSAKDLGDLYVNGGGYRPGYFVHYAATQSAPHINQVSAPITPGSAWGPAYDIVGPEMMALAEKLTAAFLKRFYESYETESFTLFMLRIDRIKTVDDDIDNFGDEDYYARVSIEGYKRTTGTIVGCDDANPQALTKFNWFFTNWLPGRPDAVAFNIYAWDEDGGLNGGDDPLDIYQYKGYGLDLNYWPATRKLTGDFNAEVGGGTFWSEGNGNDNGYIKCSVEHFPTTTKVEPVPCQAGGTILAADGKPAPGAYLYFRPAAEKSARWQRVKADGVGKFWLPSMNLLTAQYEFRPAASGHDFKAVPKVLKLMPGTNSLTFQASKQVVQAPLGTEPLSAQKVESGLFHKSQLGDPAKGGITKLDPDKKKMAKTLGEALLKVEPPSADFGVKGNSLKYVEWGTVHVYLGSLVYTGTINPITTTEGLDVEAIKYQPWPGSGFLTQLVVKNAEAGAGVPNALLKATLWFGNPLGGYRKGPEATTRTNASGKASFLLRAGTHPGSAKVTVEVLENPVNPWNKTVCSEDQVLIFAPATSGDDFGSEQPYQLTAPLTASVSSLRGTTITGAALFGSLGIGRNASAEQRAAALSALDLQTMLEKMGTPATRRSSSRAEALGGLRRSVGQPSRDPVRTPPSDPGRPVRDPVTLPPIRQRPVVFEIEALKAKAKASAGGFDVQPMSGFGPAWGGGVQLFWRPPAPVDRPIRNWPWLSVSFEVAKAGNYAVALGHTRAPDYGDAVVFLDGKEVAHLSGYSGSVVWNRLSLGTLALKEGSHTLLISVKGKAQASNGYWVGLDRLELTLAGG